MMTLFKHTRLTRLITVLILVAVVFVIITPLLTHAQTSSLKVNPDECSASLLSTSWMSAKCLIKPIIVWFGAGLLYAAGRILVVAGMLFNALIQYTVIDFGNTLFGAGIRTAVETAWEAFRDIANILIIGMFVFFSISIILGISRFNEKKNIAKVLVIAVLINFSLLFTEIIIDFSNFTAYQIYNAAGLHVGAPQTDEAGENVRPNNRGFSGAYLELLGVSTFADARQSVRNTAASDDVGWIALVHSMFGFAFILAAAVILFYGSFLLISRAILLVFLLLTSAIAFASYLIPTSYAEKFGWQQWWGSLLRAAVFAPFLMLMLWVTLVVGTAVRDGIGPGGTLGSLEADPASTGNIEAVLMYMFMIGLLFVTFKTSASFSKSISGFSMASAIPGFLGRLGAGLAANASARVARGTVGRYAYNASQTLDEMSKKSEYGNRNGVARQLFKFGSDLTKKIAESDLNAGRSGLGKSLAGTAGIKNIDDVLGKRIGGYAGQLEAENKRLASMRSEEEKAGDIAGLSQRQIEEQKRREAQAAQVGAAAQGEKIVAQAKESAKTEGDMLREALKNSPQDAERNSKAEAKKNDSDQLVSKLEHAQRNQTAVMEKQLKGLRTQAAEQVKLIQANQNDSIAKSKLNEISKEIKNAKASYNASFRESKRHIDEAKSKAYDAAKELKKVQDEITKNFKEQNKSITVGNVDAKIAATASAAGNAASDKQSYSSLITQGFKEFGKGMMRSNEDNRAKAMKKLAEKEIKAKERNAILEQAGLTKNGKITDEGRASLGIDKT